MATIMTPERYQQVRNVVEAAQERDPAERAAFLAEACRNDQELLDEVGRLLAANDVTRTLIGPPPSIRTDPASREGRRLGDYEILRQIGRGGMGSVFLARRADEAYRMNVAIKILRADAASPDIVQRFQREREILAKLDHPNIARLLDAGETQDGLPYLVMEYVNGRPIIAYADEQRLSIRHRIKLFRDVCDAVEYAHHNKIVHRDLKPSNVMVTSEGKVKLLDFGIARLLGQAASDANLTLTGMLLMTPEYASPEQVRGEPAGRESDVYSLGVLLFELVTGHRPYHLRSRIFHEIVRVVCEVPPTRPSTVIQQPIETTTSDGKPTTLPPEAAGKLRGTSLDELKQELSGDLDNILLKALQKAPRDRYASGLEMWEDIDRHEKGEVVRARANTNWYKFSRAISQNWLPLTFVALGGAAAATGAVDLHLSLLWWVLGGAVLVGLIRAAADKELGQKVADNAGWLAPVYVLAFGYGIFFGFPSWVGSNWFRYSLGAVYLPVLGFRSVRRHRFGPRIVRLGLNTPVVWRVAFGALFVWTLLADRNGLWSRWQEYLFSWLPWLLIAMDSGNELRRDGLVCHWTTVPWKRIRSWSWEQWKGGLTPHEDVLVLRLHRRIHFLPPVRVQVPRSVKGTVESILQNQLGAWPS